MIMQLIDELLIAIINFDAQTTRPGFSFVGSPITIFANFLTYKSTFTTFLTKIPLFG